MDSFNFFQLREGVKFDVVDLCQRFFGKFDGGEFFEYVCTFFACLVDVVGFLQAL